MDRKPIIAGNWKMNRNAADAGTLADDIVAGTQPYRTVADIVLCPPFTALKPVADALSGSTLKLGAQNMHWETSGAFTGEVSGAMLRDLCCEYVILGHSERRTLFGESDDDVRRKIEAALAAELTPIVCVGETLAERQAGQTETAICGQLRGCFAKMDGSALARTVVAYEPVWAIGTGLTATPHQAQEVHARIRAEIAAMTDTATARCLRIQYGGSMKPDNAAALLAQPDIDGGLIGGAALDAAAFTAIVRAAGPEG